MKILSILLLVILASGCTTYSISNQSLLDPAPTPVKVSSEPLKTLPLHVEASRHCYESSRSGRIVRTTCSNKKRINSIISHFKERGFSVVPAKNESDVSIIIKEEGVGNFVTFSTSFLNIITLGLVPAYDHDDYTVSFLDPSNNLDVTKTFRISKGKSWFHLFMFNPDNTEDRDWQNRAEQNLIRSVLDDAMLEENIPQV